MWGEAEGKRKKEGKEREKRRGKKERSLFPSLLSLVKMQQMKQATC
jgi:hypothetical protein